VPPSCGSGSREILVADRARALRIAEDRFVSESLVDAWTRGGLATRDDCVLNLADGRRYLLRDAVRILGRRNGDTDPYGLTGRVEAIRDILRRGAMVTADALRLGSSIYDLEYGFLATPHEGRGTAA
jgi:hypothetical protein